MEFFSSTFILEGCKCSIDFYSTQSVRVAWSKTLPMFSSIFAMFAREWNRWRTFGIFLSMRRGVICVYQQIHAGRFNIRCFEYTEEYYLIVCNENRQYNKVRLAALEIFITSPPNPRAMKQFIIIHISSTVCLVSNRAILILNKVEVNTR